MTRGYSRLAFPTPVLAEASWRPREAGAGITSSCRWGNRLRAVEGLARVPRGRRRADEPRVAPRRPRPGPGSSRAHREPTPHPEYPQAPASRLRNGPARAPCRKFSFPVHERPHSVPGEAAEAGRAAAGEGRRPGRRDAAGAVAARARQHGPGRPQEGAAPPLSPEARGAGRLSPGARPGGC